MNLEEKQEVSQGLLQHSAQQQEEVGCQSNYHKKTCASPPFLVSAHKQSNKYNGQIHYTIFRALGHQHTDAAVNGECHRNWCHTYTLQHP